MNLKSGYPFWLISGGLPFFYPKLEQSLSADVIILGGGISGALAAFYLINKGINSVVIDKRTIGLGSTCASTSLLQYEIDTPLCKLKNLVGPSNAVQAYKLCEESILRLGTISKKLNYDEFEFKPSLYYAAYKKDIAFLKEEFAVRKKSGFAVDFLDRQQLHKLFNINSSGAILSETGAQVNAYSFTHALHQHGLKRGVRIYDRTNIIKIEHGKRRVQLTTDDGHVVKGKVLVYATGYEACRFIDKKIVTLLSTFATVSEQFNDTDFFWKYNALIWNTANPYLYMRITKDKRILLGGRDEQFYDPRKRDSLINQKKRLLRNDFNRLFPDIKFIPEFSWAGTFGATKDGLPFIGPFKQLNNSFFALGFGGNGITFSQIAAELLVDYVTGKQNKYAHLFSFQRL